MAVNWLKVVLPIAGGFGLYQAGRGVETLGDLGKSIGDSGSALGFHVFALLLMLGALGAFIYALVQIVRGVRGDGGGGKRPRAGHARVAAAVAAVDAEPAFDADAVMARYLAKRNGGAPVEPNAKPDPRGFGRKQG